MLLYLTHDVVVRKEQNKMETKEAAAVKPQRKLPFEIYTPADKLTFLKVGIYGVSGAGKTTLAATSPKPFLINVEAGEAALIGRSDISIAKVEEFKEIDNIYKYLKHAKHDYQTVIIDSLTELQKRAMDMVLEGEGREMPHQGSWGQSMEYVRRIVRQFRDLDMHVIFIMGVADRKDAITGTVTDMPSLPGKLGQEVSSYLDVLGYLTMAYDAKSKSYSRKMKIQPSTRWHAKDRTGTLGAELSGEALNMTRIIETVHTAIRKEDAIVEDFVAPVEDE
jgi:phage nucleotide-binding protein